MTKFISHRARFKGDLAGVKVLDFRGLDFNKHTLAERMEEVVNKLEEVEPFLEEYFNVNIIEETNDEGEVKQKEKIYYNFSPNVTDELSEDINICQFLQSYATYILNSTDIKESKLEKYTILTEEEFQKRLRMEMSIDFKVDSNVIMDTRPTNDYKNLSLKITEKDMKPHLQNNKYGVRDKDIELANVLNDYNVMKEFLKTELRKIQTGKYSKYDLFKLRVLLAGINDDMLMSKVKILGIRGQAKRLGDEKPMNDYSALDYSNEQHIKYMLKHCKLTNTPRPDDMMSHIGYDLQLVIKRLYKDKELDAIDLEIIDCYNSNYTFEEIGKEVGMKKQSVDYRLNKICRKITYVI
jgi:hypothetical protein